MTLSIVDTRIADPCPDPFNMAAHVLDGAGASDDTVALEVVSASASETWTYGDLRSAVAGTATGLRDLGLAEGDRVLLRLDHSIDFPVTFLGAILAGLVPVATSAALTEAEITPMAARTGPALVIQDPAVAAPRIAAPVLPASGLQQMRGLPGSAAAMGSPERPAYMVFTSGTAAAPRGVVHAHRAIWARRMMIEDWEGMGPDDRVLHAGAFNWTYTLGTGLMDPWSVGATALVTAPGTRPADLPDLLARHRATIFAGAPGVVRQMLRAGLPPLPALRHGLSAGEALPAPLREAWRAATGTDLHEAFGQSECSTFVSGSPTRPAPPGTMGYPQRGRAVAILGPDGPVARGTPGGLAVHHDDPGLMLGYDGDPAATAKRQRGEWVLTGDVACMDASGAIAYLGRDDDVLNAGGYRVSPMEIEAAAESCPGIREAAAFEREVRPGVRVIALAYAGEVAEPVLAAHCAARLARYKQPRIYIEMVALPRGSNGKLRRRALREE